MSTPASNSALSGEHSRDGEDRTSFEDKPFLETRHRGLLMLAVLAISLTCILDITIANVALPHMQSSLGATLDTISWTLTSYIIAGVLLVPIAGWLSDRLGSRRLFIAATVGFLLSSVLCGVATSLPQMVVFRALQGVSSAFIGPMAQMILLDINPPSKQTAAMSRWGLVIMIAPICGPMLGGFLTDALNWRWVFFINLPIGIPALAIVLWLLPSRPIVPRKLDRFGFAALATGLAALQLLLDRGEHKDWFDSREIIVELIVALSAFWIFAVHTMTTQSPLFPRALMRNTHFVGALGFMFVLGVANIGISSMLPAMFQSVYGYSALDTGVLVMTRGLGTFAGMMIATRYLIKVIDIRYLAMAGYLISSAVLWDMSTWSLDMDSWPIISTGLVLGLGVGAVFVPMNMASLQALAPEHRPDAANLVNLMRNLGGSVGISAFVTMLSRNVQISHADLAAHITPFNSALNDAFSTFERLSENGSVWRMLDAEINRQAALIAYIDNFRAIALFMLGVGLSALLLKPMRIGNAQQMPISE